MQVQVSYAKLVETSMLMSTTAEAKTVPLELVLPPLLNVVSIVDVPFPFERVTQICELELAWPFYQSLHFLTLPELPLLCGFQGLPSLHIYAANF